MLTLRTIDPETAYSNFYASAYPSGEYDDLRSAPLEGVPVDSISAALSLDGITPVSQQPASTSTAPALPSVVTVANLPQTQRVTVQQDYGNASQLPVAVTGTDQVALLKPASRRVFLEIQNRSASANTVWVAFGTTASSANGIEILPGGSVTFAQFVPQDDVHLACDVAGTATAIVIYCNKDEKE